MRLAICQTRAMRLLLFSASLASMLWSAFGQGQVLFANRVDAAGLDAPFTISDGNGIHGFGSSGFSVQLFQQGTGGSLTPLLPISTFYSVAPGATGVEALADRYWVPQVVEVPGVSPGGSATFVVRAWLTSLGSYDAAFNLRAESSPFTVAVGGGNLPVANLSGLAGVNLLIPEPSSCLIAFLGTALLVVRRYITRV